MKIAHVSFSGSDGGAARAAKRIHLSLREGGQDSFFISRDRKEDPGDIQALGPLGVAGAWIHQKIERGFVELQRRPDLHMRSYGLFAGPSLGALERVQADVVNLHLTSFGFMSVRQLSEIEQPVVWTLHDMWAFSGGEHYSDDGDGARWRSGYTRTNRTKGSSGIDLDRIVWERKKRLLDRPINLVAPSNWLAQCCREAVLTKSWPVSVIPYAIDPNRFPSILQRDARQRLGLDDEEEVILFGAAGGFFDLRKGWDLLYSALRLLWQDRPRVTVLVFGGRAPKNLQLDPRIKWLGSIEDDSELAMLFSAADVLALPSRMDNLPLVGMEAQQCGLRVVAFRVCGLSDLIPSDLEGFLAEPFDVEAFSQLLGESIELSRANSTLRPALRQSSLERWSPQKIACCYLDLYSDITS